MADMETTFQNSLDRLAHKLAEVNREQDDLEIQKAALMKTMTSIEKHMHEYMEQDNDEKPVPCAAILNTIKHGSFICTKPTHPNNDHYDNLKGAYFSTKQSTLNAPPCKGIHPEHLTKCSRPHGHTGNHWTLTGNKNNIYKTWSN